MHGSKLAACAALVLALGACGREGPPSDPSASPDPARAADSEPATGAVPNVPTQEATQSSGSPVAGLENAHWTLVQVAGNPLVVTPADHAEPYLRLAQKRVQGHGGCNRMSGTYELDGSTLKFGPIMATKMACMDPRNPENAFFGALERSTAWRVSGDTLELLDASGATVAILRAAPKPAP